MSTPVKAVLQKPPGYREPSTVAAAAAAVQTDPRPPPRKPQLPPSFRQAGKPPPPQRQRRREPRCRCRRLCCWALIILLAAAVLLAAAGGLCYLWFQPRAPTFRIESVNMTRFSVAARSDGTYLDAAAFARVQVANPNAKISLRYGDIRAAISLADGDGDVQIGSAVASGFVQGKKNSTVVRFGAAVKGQFVEDVVGSRLKAQFRSRAIRLVLEIRTRVGMRIRNRTAASVPIKVVCAPVSLKQMEKRSLTPKCGITFFRWITVH